MILIEWRRETDRLVAREASRLEIAEKAPRLAAWYSDAHNRSMMDGGPMTAADVIEFGLGCARPKGAWFFLYRDGEIIGDADFRRIEPPVAEFAIMIGEKSIQGKGLGQAFSTMLHVYAFDGLALERVYLSVLSKNLAGRRCYEKLGYTVDRSPDAEEYVEGPEDTPMSLERSTFLNTIGDVRRAIRVEDGGETPGE